MALKTTLTATFSNSNPILQRDPAIPSAGGVVLFDFLARGTWPSQGSPITSYASLVNNDWPSLAPTNNHTYSPSTGRVTPSNTSTLSFPCEPAAQTTISAGITLPSGSVAPVAVTLANASYLANGASRATLIAATPGTLVRDGSGNYTFAPLLAPASSVTIASGSSVANSATRLFADPTANYYLDFWAFRPTTFTSLRNGYFGGNTAQSTPNTSTEHSILITGSNTQGIEIRRPSPGSFDGNYINLQPTANAVFRIGYGWAKNGGIWQHRAIVNNGTPTNWANSTHGSGANGIQDNAAWTNRLFGGFGGATSDSNLGIYRFYVENLSISGRTFEEAAAACWAAATRTSRSQYAP